MFSDSTLHNFYTKDRGVVKTARCKCCVGESVCGRNVSACVGAGGCVYSFVSVY